MPRNFVADILRYIITVSSATAIGPLIASFIVADTEGTWRNFSWLCAGLAGLNLALMFLFYPESTFSRTSARRSVSSYQPQIPQLDYKGGNEPQPSSTQLETKDPESPNDPNDGVQHVEHIDVAWTQIWLSFFRYDRTVGLAAIFLRPLCYIIYPVVLWTVFVYGTSLASQVILMYVLSLMVMNDRR